MSVFKSEGGAENAGAKAGRGNKLLLRIDPNSILPLGTRVDSSRAVVNIDLQGHLFFPSANHLIFLSDQSLYHH